MDKNKVKVYKNTGEIPAENILCTTYQMRNFYHQLRDGFFSDLDIMNYIQHHKAVLMMKKNSIVLDVCCGRGLLLPLLRYYKKEIQEYIGVDIEEKNIESKYKNICTGKEINPETFYPFKTTWKIGNVSDIFTILKDYSKKIDFIVYTSAIEHMNKSDGAHSLEGIRKLIKPDGIFFLSCPNTPEDQSGFDVRYKAHVYEWKSSELKKELEKNNFTILKEIGLTGDIKKYKTIKTKMNKETLAFIENIEEYIPTPWLKPFLFVNTPDLSSEILFICTPKKGFF